MQARYERRHHEEAYASIETLEEMCDLLAYWWRYAFDRYDLNRSRQYLEASGVLIDLIDACQEGA